MTTVTNQPTLEEAKKLKHELLTQMFATTASTQATQPSVRSGSPATPLPPKGHNIVGTGFGARMTNGAGYADEYAVIVYVRTKKPYSELSRDERVPNKVNGVPTDVVAVGNLTLQARPVNYGASIGHVDITSGTLGCVVKRTGRGEDRFILSNNHVLANNNKAQLGDKILEPGPSDGGDPNNPIATLDDFEPIDFAQDNTMDAAVAKLNDSASVIASFPSGGTLGIGSVVQPPADPTLFQSVRKRGRTTLNTIGVVLDIAADISVGIGNRSARFVDQLRIVGVGGLFSDGGDSGSLIVDAVTRRPVALLFAGGQGNTFASPIQPILTRFGATIL